MLATAFEYAQREKQTPWLKSDTASQYQWYPCLNVGHYELARAADGKIRKEVIAFYKKGIDMVWQKAKGKWQLIARQAVKQPLPG